MKRYGFKFPMLDDHGTRYLELRTLGLISALVLAVLFGEPWLYLLGFAFFAFGTLAVMGAALVVDSLSENSEPCQHSEKYNKTTKLQAKNKYI